MAKKSGKEQNGTVGRGDLYARLFGTRELGEALYTSHAFTYPAIGS
ncbi:MAG: hypothetical protein NTY81_02600 [Candidatus Staskawiczbacteria bacterium]|nr:hypothetical protein [Candidatus Staskawiczbacteria bacterium]